MEEEGKSKREDWGKKDASERMREHSAAAFFLPTLTLLCDKHDWAGEEQLRLNLFASIKLQITSQSFIFF